MKKYSSNEDSDVKWIGKIPKHWKIKKLKYVTECLDSKRIPLNSEERYFKKGKILVSSL